MEERILKGPDLALSKNCSIGAFILENLTKHGNKIAHIYSLTGESCTHLDIKKQSIRVAKQLRARGIGLGDVISICSANTPTSALPLLAGIYIGAPISPLDPTLHKSDVKHLMNITTPKIIFTEQSCLQMIEEVIAELQLSTEIVIFGESENYSVFSQFLIESIDSENFEPINFTNPQDHIAFLMSSSGTTGLPKCVALSHAAILFQIQLTVLADFPSDLSMLNMSSLFWVSNILVTLMTSAAGGIRILTPPFQPEHTLETVEKYKVVSIVVGVTFFARTVSHPKASEFDLSSVKIVYIVGGKASNKHIDIGKKLFPSALLISTYGLTETCGTVFKSDKRKPTAVGNLLPGLECKIADVENGASLGPNEKGEICFRGKYFFSGYYKNEKATRETVDKDGWLHTGDLGYYDDEKCFYVVDRIKELFKCKGWQISPIELEKVLMEHPAIKEAAVVGVPHKVDVARPFAFLVKQQNFEVTKHEISLYMKNRVNSHKQLTGGIVFVDSLPTTPTGKIRRKDLIKLAPKYLTCDDESKQPSKL